MDEKSTNQNETSGLSSLGNVKVDTDHASVLQLLDAYDQVNYLYGMDN